MNEPDAGVVPDRTGSRRWHFRRWHLWLIWLLPVLGAGWTVGHAPDWLEPRTLTVALEPGHTMTLSREALWAPQADREPVLLRREADGSWRLVDLSSGKPVLWRPASAAGDRPVRTWPLTEGTTFAVGGQSFTVLAADRDRVTLQTANQRWDYDGFRLQRDGQPLPEGYPGWRNRWRNGRAALGLVNRVKRPLRLGGGVYCADRLGIAGVAVDTAIIAPTPTGFALQSGEAGRADGSPITVAVGTPQEASLWRQSIPLNMGDQVLIGHTRYGVAQTAPTLKLSVLSHAQRRLAGTEPSGSASVLSVEWQPVAWRWPLGGALSLLVLGRVWSNRSTGWKIAGGLVLAGACLGAYVGRETLPGLWPYFLAWPVMGLWLVTVRSPWSVGVLIALTLLLGGGLITLLQLGIGASEAGGLSYGSGNAALAGAFGWLAWAGWNGWHAWRPVGGLDPRWIGWSVRVLGGAAFALLAAQFLFGNEQGWAGVQPFEMTQLALTAMAADALRRRPVSEGGSGNPLRGLRVLGPLGLLAAVSGFAFLFLRDFSPLVLLLFWALALAGVWLQVQPHRATRQFGQIALFVLIALVALGLTWLYQRPEDFPLDFQADRIRVWVAPDRYPHAGYQLRRALEAIQTGGWWGTVWTEPTNGRVMTIPVVENDFTLAFFLHRYGGLAGLGLAGLQALWCGVLWIIAGRALDRTGHGPERTAFAEWAGFAVYGGAALLAAHFLVSWGANLGFLPVMGQPMPLLSAAGSHLTLFVLPVVALAVAVEENHHVDSL